MGDSSACLLHGFSYASVMQQNSVNSNDVPSVASKKISDLSTLKTSIQRKTWRVPYAPTMQQKSVNSTDAPSVMSKKRSGLSTMTSIQHKTWKVPSTPPKSLRALLNLVPSNGPDKDPVFPTKKTQSSGHAQSSCSTPFKTPAQAYNKSVSAYPATTPRSENRRMKTPIDSSASGIKTTGPKWHILSAVCAKSLSAYRSKLQSPTVSTPFTLRTEEREEKAGDEFRKLSCSLCFKARPLPDLLCSHSQRC